MPLEPGDVFAGYRILRTVGVGGMGTVYLAEHPRLPRCDALKVLDSATVGDPDFRIRFEREAELAARLEHPHIVSVYDCGTEGDRLWIAMRYVDGIDAAELIRRSSEGIPPARAVGIVDGAARGLDAAHRRRLLHRDVKPANILVGTHDDGSDDVRVADFGIARALDETAGPTSTGSTPATLAYAAPEQFDNRPLDLRVDVYALGCTLFHLLTGVPPFGGRTTAATIHAHLFEPPPRPSQLRGWISPAMDEVIATAMAKDPNQRFDSCGELAAAALRAVDNPAAGAAGSPVRALTETVVAQHAAHPRSPSPPPAASLPNVVSPPAARRPRWVLPIAVAAVVLVTAVVGTAALLTRTSGDLSGTAIAGGFGSVVSSTSADSGSAQTSITAASTPSAASATPTVVATDSGAGSTGASAWGPAQYIVAAFPELLPADPEGAGYQGMRCGLNDDVGAWLHCPSDDPDGISVNIRCDPQRNRVLLDRSGIGETGIQEQVWSRPSGSGIVRWSSDSISGSGLLSVVFDDPDRYFCSVGASGGSGGQDVFDRWWTGAPL